MPLPITTRGENRKAPPTGPSLCKSAAGWPPARNRSSLRRRAAVERGDAAADEVVELTVVAVVDAELGASSTKWGAALADGPPPPHVGSERRKVPSTVPRTKPPGWRAGRAGARTAFAGFGGTRRLNDSEPWRSSRTTPGLIGSISGSLRLRGCGSSRLSGYRRTPVDGVVRGLSTKPRGEERDRARGRQ